MFVLEPVKNGQPISFADCPEFTKESVAIANARRLNGDREDNPDADDGIRYNVYMDLPGGDSALIWDHKIGHTYVG
jgi:hypothetical protein